MTELAPPGLLLELFGRCLLLSLLSIGGAMAVAPELHRFLVDERALMSEAAFGSAVALAQAAPGPNLLFVPVLGFQLAGVAGALSAMVGILLPSTVLSLAVSRWGTRHRDHPGVRAFKAWLAPVTVGLMGATAWLLAQPFVREPGARGPALALIVLSALAMGYTRLSPVWLIGLGGMAGALGAV